MRQLTASSALAAEARATLGNSAWLTRLMEWYTTSWIAVVADAGLPTSALPAVVVAPSSVTTSVSSGSISSSVLVSIAIVPEAWPVPIVSDPLGAV